MSTTDVLGAIGIAVLLGALALVLVSVTGLLDGVEWEFTLPWMLRRFGCFLCGHKPNPHNVLCSRCGVRRMVP